MAIVRPNLCHRLALAVRDAGKADEWFRDIFGAVPISGVNAPRRDDPTAQGGADLEGTDTRMLWHGGYPMILLSGGLPGGPVAGFLERYGPAVHSLAWEIEDMWGVEHGLRDHGIHITGVNVPGRHFFMHPRDTHGVLLEWTDDQIPGDSRRPGVPAPGEGGGVVGVSGIAWVTAVVTDADRTAALLAELSECERVDGNPRGPDAAERTIDLRIGDITLRLVTPRSAESRYAPVLERGPRLWSYTLRVPDLDQALDALGQRGISVVQRDDSLAATDPSATLGVAMEFTQ